MTIDEAIAQEIKKSYKNSACRNCTNPKDCITCIQEHKQLAEWLEKLQYIENIILKWNADWYNDEDTGIPDNEILEAIFNACTDNGFDIQIDEDYREGYNKAIDDFRSKLIMHFADWELSQAPCNDDETDSTREIICETIENAIGGVEEIAEQLKAGGDSEI